MRRMAPLAAVLLLVACCLLAGCGGGGSGDVSGASGAAVFTVHWPTTAGTSVRPALIPEATRSITVILTQAAVPVGPPQTVTRDAGGPTTATITYDNLPPGQYTATATAYPNPDGTGTPLATASVPINVQAGATSQINLVLDSTILTVTVAPSSAAVAVDGTYQLTATAKDAAGNVVLISPSMSQWNSNALGIATVNNAGLVTGVAPGDAQVTFTETESGELDTADISVLTSGIRGKVIDLQTQQPIAGAIVQVYDGQSFVTQVLTGPDGLYTCAVAPGLSYLVAATAVGYEPNFAPNVGVWGGLGTTPGLTLVVFALPPTGSDLLYGTVCGKVYHDTTDAPLPEVTVTIDGGAQTNGVFASTVTAGDGTYAIYGIPVFDTNGQPIPSFRLRASKPGFLTATLPPVTVAANQTQTSPSTDFDLVPSGGGGDAYRDDFESDSGWAGTGFWHRQLNANILNQAVPDYVTLPPGDASGGRIPDAFSGTHSWWYGSPNTGNYIGVQISDDGPLSGGTSTEANMGTLTSPPINISGVANPELTFMAWFEIESVAPNADGFDLMIVSASTDGDTFTELARLNPFADPTVDNRNALAYTSGGFNQPANWVPAIVDLSDFAGGSVWLRFEFNTMDHLYNGFRGWFIDDVSIHATTGGSIEAGAAGLRLPRTRALGRGHPRR
jgi:hypothetical protein